VAKAHISRRCGGCAIYQVSKGTAEGSVRLTLKTAAGTFQAWLRKEQAERLAADHLELNKGEQRHGLLCQCQQS
jgi:hypothetical protein